MSVKAMAIAWEADLKPGAKLVLLAIADHSDGKGVCWPGQEHIAEKCNMNRSTVNQHIGDLVSLGYLFVEKGRSKTGQAVKATYRVNLESPVLEKPTLGKQKKQQKNAKPTLENATSPVLEKPTLESPVLEKPTLEKHASNVGKDNIPPLYEPSIEPSIICSDPIGSPQAVIKIPLNIKNTFQEIYEEDVLKYSELYPAVDVMQELRGMIGWSDANPKKRKTKDGVMRFVNSWLAKAQDMGGSKYSNSRPAITQQTKPASQVQYIPKHLRNGAFGNDDFIDSTAKAI